VLGADTKPAAPPPVAAGAPRPVDAATARRADRAAQEFLDQQERNQTPADPEAIAALADAEVLLLECSAFIEKGLSTKAGESFLGAGKKMKEIGSDQRRLLGDRYRKASDALTGLSRKLLGDETFNPPDESAGDTPTAAPDAAK
nr:hypothetical protein [Planctomycetota bacterium]